MPRLNEIERIFKKITPGGIGLEFYLTPEPKQNDEVLAKVSPYSLIVNATGLGKDRPGSPLTDACAFPENSMVWEINYRGDLKFMHQALAQRQEKNLHVEDGWKYFIHGWSQVIAEVFHVDLNDRLMRALDEAASATRKGA